MHVELMKVCGIQYVYEIRRLQDEPIPAPDVLESLCLYCVLPDGKMSILLALLQRFKRCLVLKYYMLAIIGHVTITEVFAFVNRRLIARVFLARRSRGRYFLSL
jgi:hypothetical protein